MSTALKILRDWRDDLGEDRYVGATTVQDVLLSFRSGVGEQGTALVDECLALTRHRQLFTADELRGLLDSIEAAATSLN